MLKPQKSIDENSILYELLVYTEWYQEGDSIVKILTNNQSTPSFSNLLTYANPLRLWSKVQATFDIKSVSGLPWKFAVSDDGKVAAVLQETLLEIRTLKDGFITVVGKASVPADQYPQLRKLCWSPDNTCLAVAKDNGTVTVFNLFGSNLTTITAESTDRLNPVVGLSFLDSKVKSTKWSSELLIVYFDGTVSSYLLSALDCHAIEENIKCSLSQHYPRGIYTAVYHPTYHILITAGNHTGQKGSNSIMSWRILNDHPFLKPSLDAEDVHPSGNRWFSTLSGGNKEEKIVQKMKISPNGRLLACLISGGTISLWSLPGVRLHRKWSLEEQPGFSEKPQSQSPDKAKKEFSPVDVDWWSNEAVVIVRKSGALSVCSTKTLENLLGEAPEHLCGPPQVASVCGEREGVLVLDCEVAVNYRHRSMSVDGENIDQLQESDGEDEASVLQASIQAALYSATDIDIFQPKKKAPKFVQKTYRLLGLKTITPEELYATKIDNGSYEDALTLAQAYNLDADLVYQRQWRMNPVSSFAINHYLRKVSKVQWVANECVQRTPDSISAAFELLRFGLNVTDIQEEIGKKKYIELSMDQQRLINLRLQIISYLDSLTLYEKILGTQCKYESSEYDDLRKMCPLEAAVKFARDEKCDAVRILLTYRSKEVLSHWLPVISNFPETLRPSKYRKLLPRIQANNVVPWETSTLRDADWAESLPERKPDDSNGDTENWDLYNEEPNLRQFHCETLTVTLVEQWYRMRGYQIEELTGSVENVATLIRLARERNVPNLERLYFDLLTLDALVTNVNDNITSLITLESLSHLEQSKLLLSRTTTNTFINDLKSLFLPFVTRCEEKGCHDKLGLIRGLLLQFGSTSLRLPLEFFKHLGDHVKCPLKLSPIDKMSITLDVLYTCSADDELENALSILECLPDRSNSIDSPDELEEKLHNRIDILEKHLLVCEILQQNSCPKSVKFIQENENNKDVAREIMESVATHVKSETLNFTHLIDDLLSLQEVFACIDVQECYEICAYYQMICECEEIILSADQYLSCWSKETWKPIPFNKSLQLILEAASTHFERSLNFEDPFLKYAETCLSLVSESHPDVCKELSLIEAVKLLGDFGVRILPIQVRIISDRTSLLEKCLDAKPDAYKSCQRLIQLAHSLRLNDDDSFLTEGQVLTMVAQRAHDARDYKFCSDICARLVTKNYAPSWGIIQKLGESSDFMDKKKKLDFLAYAVLHCPQESIEEVVDARCKLNDGFFKKLCCEDGVKENI